MSRAIMQQALDALKYHTEHTYPFHQTNVAIELLKKELANPEQELPTLRQVVIESALKSYGKPEQEPVGQFVGGIPEVSQQREWNGLSETEIRGCTCECVDNGTFTMACAIDFARALEATLKDRNTTNQ